MMNSVSPFNVSSSQVAFAKKIGNRKEIHEFIDKTNDVITDYLHKDRSINEIKERAIKKSVSKVSDYLKIIKDVLKEYLS